MRTLDLRLENGLCAAVGRYTTEALQELSHPNHSIGLLTLVTLEIIALW
jgi:hypothetical protein